MASNRNAFSINRCAYCQHNGKPGIGHTKNNCPVLAGLDPCKICGAYGTNNHTAMYCPFREPVKLEPDEKKMAEILAMHIDDPPDIKSGEERQRHHNTAERQLSIPRAPNILITPTKRNDSLGASATTTPISSTSTQFSSLSHDNVFQTFYDARIWDNSPTAHMAFPIRSDRISSTPTTIPPWSPATGVSKNVKRCLSFGSESKH